MDNSHAADSLFCIWFPVFLFVQKAVRLQQQS
jgi:hypothetical protein